MKYIKKGNEPEGLLKWKKQFRKKENCMPRYEDLNKYPEEKKRLKNSLLEEQGALCGYCCSHIVVDKMHIEHIRPKGVPKYANLSLDYGNLMGCCRPSPKNSRCGDSKKSRYDEALFISPYDPECNQYFGYKAYSGEVYAKDDNPKANYMIDLLNLNEPSLKRARIEAYWESMIEQKTIDEMYLFEQFLENVIDYPYMDAMLFLLRERINEYNG